MPKWCDYRGELTVHCKWDGPCYAATATPAGQLYDDNKQVQSNLPNLIILGLHVLANFFINLGRLLIYRILFIKLTIRSTKMGPEIFIKLERLLL